MRTCQANLYGVREQDRQKGVHSANTCLVIQGTAESMNFRALKLKA
jgi:hypothetical protein